jgi:hypothetical protein
MAGFFVAAALVLALGEVYLHVSPPSDLIPYLVDEDRAGPFRPDPRYGVQYRSLDTLVEDNPGRFDAYRDLLSAANPPPSWALFGSSFVQAPGMLADTAREFVPRRVILNLGKNEPLPVRFAQADLLLECGLKPSRIFFVIIPLDVFAFASHGLGQFRTTAGGALAYAPSLPRVGGAVVSKSRLALKGWTRTKLHLNLPFFAAAGLHDRLDPAIQADVRTVFEHFAATAERHNVPVTLVLLPDYEQVTRNEHLALQEVLAIEAGAVGFDVCDAYTPFRMWPDKPGLFVPDKHFSATGNRLLLAAVIEHLKALEPHHAHDLPDPALVRPAP